MRRLSIFAILLMLIFGGLWLGGETLLTRELRKLSDKDPKVEFGSVTELRELQRIGVHLGDIQLQTPAGLLSLPMTELWLSPLHLTEGRLNLPDEAVLNTPAGPKTLGLGRADASLRLRPLSGLTLGSLALNSGAMTIEGSELTQGLRVSAELGRLGHGAPLGALAAYDVDIALDQFDPTPLAPQIKLPGAVQFTAQGRVWLDGAPGPRTLEPETRPALVGFEILDAELGLGRVSTRISGRLQADALGLAEGELSLSTRDIKPLLQAAAGAGLIPEQAVTLAETVWKKLATRRDGATETESAGQDAGEGSGPELRLPLTFSDGKIRLGPLPLGPAPQFPR